MFIKSTFLTMAILATGCSTGLARLFSSHQYPPPVTTPAYPRVPDTFATHSQYGSSYRPTSYQLLSSIYPGRQQPQLAHNINNEGDSLLRDYISMLELAARQRYNLDGVSPMVGATKQYHHSGYSPHAQTKQHHHAYRQSLSVTTNPEQANVDQVPQYQHLLEPIVYEADNSYVQYGAGSIGKKSRPLLDMGRGYHNQNVPNVNLEYYNCQ